MINQIAGGAGSSGVLNPTDYYELQIATIALMNVNIEFWLGITFAVIVAFHFASGGITKRFYQFALSLYLVSSIFFAVRYFNAVSAFVAFDEILIEAGFEPYPIGNSLLVFIATVSLFSVGTVGTALFIYKCTHKTLNGT